MCCDVSLLDAAYYCIQAFALAEFAASLEWQFYCYLLLNRNVPSWSKAILLIIVYASVFLYIGWLVRRLAEKGDTLHITGKELSVAVIIGIAVFVSSNLSFLSINTPFSGQYGREIYNIRTIMDLGGLAILYAHRLQFTAHP